MCYTGNMESNVFRIADNLWANGINPTVRAIRYTLGCGSFATIAPLLKEWRHLVRNGRDCESKTSTPTAPTRSAITPETLKAGDMIPRAIFEQQMTVMQDEMDGLRKHLMIETDRIRREASGDQNKDKVINKLEAELFLTQARLAAAERKIR